MKYRIVLQDNHYKIQVQKWKFLFWDKWDFLLVEQKSVGTREPFHFEYHQRKFHTIEIARKFLKMYLAHKRKINYFGYELRLFFDEGDGQWRYYYWNDYKQLEFDHLNRLQSKIRERIIAKDLEKEREKFVVIEQINN